MENSSRFIKLTHIIASLEDLLQFSIHQLLCRGKFWSDQVRSAQYAIGKRLPFWQKSKAPDQSCALFAGFPLPTSFLPVPPSHKLPALPWRYHDLDIPGGPIEYMADNLIFVEIPTPV
jgi:hypothetical protein